MSMEKIVFTNGCFDLLHQGHVELLAKARQLGTKLIVGINSDRSVRSLKGVTRPLNNENARAEVLRALRSVDEVIGFDENTPERLIREIKPDVLVKGGDWAISEIVGADFVLKRGGEVISIPFESDFSSSKLIEKILNVEKNHNEVDTKNTTNREFIESNLSSYIGLFTTLLDHQIPQIQGCEEIIADALKNGNKTLIIGTPENFQAVTYFEAKFTGTKKTESSTSKELINDLNVNEEAYYSEQIQHANKGDLVIVLGGANDKADLLNAVMEARNLGCRTIALVGNEGKKLASLCDANVSAASGNSDEIQAVQIALANIWSKMASEKIN
jgi:rfaE bifunctional protein nucleotidyltransferase chain/domain